MTNTRILYKGTLLYKGVSLIHIDETNDAPYWIARQGLEKTDRVMDFNSGAWFDIYENKQRGLACAIPV